MNKIWTVATREFLETVKSKTFLISSVFMPMLIVGVMLATDLIARTAREEKRALRTIAVIDESGVLAEPLEQGVKAHNERNPNQPLALEPHPAPRSDAKIAELDARIKANQLYAYLSIPAGVLDGEAVEFGRADSQLQALRQISNMLDRAATDVRREQAGIAAETLMSLQRPVELKQRDVATGAETTGNEIAQMLTPFAFMFLMFMAIMNIAQGLLTSLIEEKSTRVIEVLLSAVSPTQLMAGKVLGMVGVGSLLLLIWGVLGYAGAQMRDVPYLVSPFRLTYMVLYFIPGFLFFSAVLAAIGSACNTLKDAQGMAVPLNIAIVIPMMLWWYVVEQPNSVYVVALSYVPPLTPFLMILRICADPNIPMVQIVTTLALMWASVIFMIWAAGKIFRVGVLMYGKAPGFGELWKWVRMA